MPSGAFWGVFAAGGTFFAPSAAVVYLCSAGAASYGEVIAVIVRFHLSLLFFPFLSSPLLSSPLSSLFLHLFFHSFMGLATRGFVIF